jgi:hypothetical protein
MNQKDVARVEELIVKYGDLAKKLAWKYWKKLPPAAKMWIDPEDLISEAYLCFATKIKEKYDANRASESTFIWHTLSNLFTNLCLQQAQSRRKAITLSLDEALEALSSEGEIPKFDIKFLGRPDQLVKQREALYSLASVYRDAGEECQARMRRWFGQRPTKLKRLSWEDKIWNAEFKFLADKYRLNMDDCLLLMRSGVCLY